MIPIEDIVKKINEEENDNIRENYEKEVSELKNEAEFLDSEGWKEKEIAFYLWTRRRLIGVKYKLQRQEEYRNNIFKRNLEKYGNKWGPTFNELEKKKNYEEIIESSVRTNKNYNELRKKFKK